MSIPQYYKDAGLTHFSASQLNKPVANWIFDYLYLNYDRRRAIKVGYNAALGTNAHNAIQAVLCHGQSVEDAIKDAVMGLEFHDAPTSELSEKRDKFIEILPDMVNNGVNLLAERFGGAEDERRIELPLDGIDVPIVGFIDLIASDSFLEIKTKAARQGAVKKDGTRSWTKGSLPSKPEFYHLSQVAIYWKATGLTPHIAYVAAHDAVLFSPDNCDELSQDYLEYCLEDMRGKAMRRQNLLKLSTDPKVLAGLVDPDFNHPFYWDEETISEAKELWKI